RAHEAQMEEHGTGQQPVPVREEEAHRRGKAENECSDRQLVGGDGRLVRGPLDQPRGEWIDQTDRPPRVTWFICLFSYVVEGEMRHSRGSEHRASCRRTGDGSPYGQTEGDRGDPLSGGRWATRLVSSSEDSLGVCRVSR